MRSPLFPFFLTLGVFVAGVALGRGTLSINLGRFTVYMMDLMSIFLIVTSSSRLFFTQKRVKIIFIPVFILGILILISWFRGINFFGIEASTNGFRLYIYFFATLFFTISLKYSDKFLRVFSFWLGVSGWVLIAIAFVRWFFVVLGLASSPDWIAAGGMMVRVIFAAPTFFLLQILILSWHTNKQPWKMPFVMLIPYVFLPVILILQHRTVWVALAFTLFLILVLNRKLKGILAFGLLSIFILIIIIIEWGNFSAISLNGTVFDLRNFDWRVNGWLALITPERFQSPLDLLIGQPFGTGYARYLPWMSDPILVSPHNFYIETFLNIGGLGLAILLTLYGSVLKVLWDSRSNELSRGFIIILAVQLVFFMSYSASYEQGFILGLALLFGTEKNE